jgi:hypothetical protein
VDSFKGKFEKFSNFYPCVIYYEDFNFPSVEHAFVAAKSTDLLFRKKISEIPGNKAGLAKKLGRQCKLRPNWDLIKISMMRRFLMQKFSYDEFKSLLLSTGDATLIEGNYWHDNYWGDCYCQRCKNIKGLNNLGKLLMKVRRNI